MTRYFTAPDGADEPTIWERTDGDPAVVVRRAELPGPRADLLWRMLTEVLCADDETVERMARVLWERFVYDGPGNAGTSEDHWLFTRTWYVDHARAVFAALQEGR